MKKFTVSLLVLFLWLFVSHTLFSQLFVATTNKSNVNVGERFRVTYKLENMSGNNFRLGSIADFTVAGGPYQSQQMSMINGVTTQSIQISYDFIANKKGSFTIPPATIQTSKGTLKSNTIEITVGEGSTGNSQGSNANKNNSGTQNTNSGKSELFIVASPNKSSVYEGEQITLSIKLYSQFTNVSFEDIKYPELKGGWVQDVADAVDKQFQNEVYNGRRYYTATMRKSILVPTASGKLIFDPVEATVLAQRRVTSNDWWEDFFTGGRVQTESMKLTSSRITFNVLPLPEENKPVDFTNAVGKFEMKVSVDTNEVEANDAITLRVKISGNGNLMLLNNPNVIFPNSFEVPDPMVKDNIKVTSSGITGSREFEYLIIPRSGGDFKIEPVVFSYFDPSLKKYIQLKSDTIKIKVNGKVIENLSTGSRSDVELLGKDIRYIEENSGELISTRKFFFRSPLYYVLSALPYVLTFLIIGFRKQLFQRVTDVEKSRIKKANTVAIKRLRIAKQMLDGNNRDKYYEELNKAMLGYLSDKFSIPLADMSKQFITEKLMSKNLDSMIIDQFSSIMEKCEFARFAPGSESEREDLYQVAVDVITKIENQG